MEVSLVRARLSWGLVATFLGLLAILQRGALARPPRARREPRPSGERRRPRLRARQRAARGDVGSVVRRAKGAAICQAEELRLDAYRSYVEPLLPDVSARVIDGVKRIGEGRPAADEATPASIDVHAVALRASHEPCKARGVHRAVPETTPSAPQLPPALDDEDWWEGKGFSRPGTFANAPRQNAADRGTTRNLSATAWSPWLAPCSPFRTPPRPRGRHPTRRRRPAHRAATFHADLDGLVTARRVQGTGTRFPKRKGKDDAPGS
jgi:hypothetical protein